MAPKKSKSNSSKLPERSGRKPRSASRNQNSNSSHVGSNPIDSSNLDPCSTGDLNCTAARLQQPSPCLTDETPQRTVDDRSHVGSPRTSLSRERQPDQSGQELERRLDTLTLAFQHSQDTMQSLQSDVQRSQENLNSLQSTLAELIQRLGSPLIENVPSQQTGVYATPRAPSRTFAGTSQMFPDDTGRNQGSFLSLDDEARDVPSNLAQNEQQVETDRRQSSLPRGITPAGSPQIVQDSDESANSTNVKYAPGNWHHTCDSRQVIVNQISPPMFHGEELKARAWLLEYENAMKVNNYSQAQMYKRVSPYLKDEAMQWWLSDNYQYPDSNWTSFRKRFLKHFSGGDSRETLTKELNAARQKPGESPKTYFARASGICLQHDPNMPDKKLVKYIAKRLRPEIHNILTPLKPQEEWTYKWLGKHLGRMKVERPDRHEETESRQPRGSPTRSPSPKPWPPRNLKTWLCFNCNVTGHIEEDCPQPRNEDNIKANREAFARRKAEKENQTSREVNRINIAPSRAAVFDLPCYDHVKPMMTLNLNGINVEGRIDTGADMSLISESLARTLNVQVVSWASQVALKAVNGTPIRTLGVGAITAAYSNTIRPILVAVVPDKQLTKPLWGIDILTAFSIKIDLNLTSPERARSAVNVDQRPVVEVTLPKRQPLNTLTIGCVSVRDKPSIGTSPSSERSPGRELPDSSLPSEQRLKGRLPTSSRRACSSMEISRKRKSSKSNESNVALIRPLFNLFSVGVRPEEERGICEGGSNIPRRTFGSVAASPMGGSCIPDTNE